MSSIKKLPQSAPSQNYASSDPCSGNNKSGVNVKVMNWPYQGFTVDNEINPNANKFPAPQLSQNPHAYSDTGGKVARGRASNQMNTDNINVGLN